VVRGTVEETLNALLDAEADRLCNAQRYESSAARRDTRAGQADASAPTALANVMLPCGCDRASASAIPSFAAVATHWATHMPSGICMSTCWGDRVDSAVSGLLMFLSPTLSVLPERGSSTAGPSH